MPIHRSTANARCRSLIIFVIFAPTLAIGTSELAGQEGVSRESLIESHLNSLKLSSQVLLTTDSERHEGRLVSRSADSLSLSRAEGTVHLPLSAVDSIWARRGQTSKGFLLGLLAGVGTYVLITSLQEDSDDPAADNAKGALAGLGLLGLGTVIGAATRSWERLYP